MIYALADRKMEWKAIEKASARICEIDTGKSDPDTLVDETLKRLFGLRENLIGYTDFSKTVVFFPSKGKVLYWLFCQKPLPR